MIWNPNSAQEFNVLPVQTFSYQGNQTMDTSNTYYQIGALNNNIFMKYAFKLKFLPYYMPNETYFTYFMGESGGLVWIYLPLADWGGQTPNVQVTSNATGQALLGSSYKDVRNDPDWDKVKCQ